MAAVGVSTAGSVALVGENYQMNLTSYDTNDPPFAKSDYRTGSFATNSTECNQVNYITAPTVQIPVSVLLYMQEQQNRQPNELRVLNAIYNFNYDDQVYGQIVSQVAEFTFHFKDGTPTENESVLPDYIFVYVPKIEGSSLSNLQSSQSLNPQCNLYNEKARLWSTDFVGDALMKQCNHYYICAVKKFGKVMVNLQAFNSTQIATKDYVDIKHVLVTPGFIVSLVVFVFYGLLGIALVCIGRKMQGTPFRKLDRSMENGYSHSQQFGGMTDANDNPWMLCPFYSVLKTESRTYGMQKSCLLMLHAMTQSFFFCVLLRENDLKVSILANACRQQIHYVSQHC